MQRKQGNPRRRSPKKKAIPTFHWEEQARQQGFNSIAGVDEVGRGPLAGPVVAAAVILPHNYNHPWLRDSKQLSPSQRDTVRNDLESTPDVLWGLGQASVEEIEEWNILQASLLAMRRAVQALPLSPDFLLIDGKYGLKGELPEQTLVQGDSQSCSIAAASILAKENRDAMMGELARHFPHYGFEKHKGYPTQEHRTALIQHGPTPHHRRLFLRKTLGHSPSF